MHGSIRKTDHVFSGVGRRTLFIEAQFGDQAPRADVSKLCHPRLLRKLVFEPCGYGRVRFTIVQKAVVAMFGQDPNAAVRKFTGQFRITFRTDMDVVSPREDQEGRFHGTQPVLGRFGRRRPTRRHGAE